MTTNRYRVPVGFVIVPEPIGAELAVFVAAGRRAAEREGIVMRPEVLEVFEALRSCSPSVASMGAVVPQPEPVSWISTAEAAGSLGVTPRHVRSLAASRWGHRRRGFVDQADVEVTLSLRNLRN